MSEDYHSYLVGRGGPDGVWMFDEPIEAWSDMTKETDPTRQPPSA